MQTKIFGNYEQFYQFSTLVINNLLKLNIIAQVTYVADQTG